MVLVDSDYLVDLKSKANSSGKSQVEDDIINEAVKIATNEVSSAYVLCQLAKELIIARRAAL